MMSPSGQWKAGAGLEVGSGEDRAEEERVVRMVRVDGTHGGMLGVGV
jgi:hypothetical protein